MSAGQVDARRLSADQLDAHHLVAAARPASVLPTTSPHRLVEFLTAVSRCEDAATVMAVAASLVAEELDAEVGAVLLGTRLTAAVGFGHHPVPRDLLAALPPGVVSVELEGVGDCHALTAGWKTKSAGRLVVARVDGDFGEGERSLVLGMAQATGLAVDSRELLEQERDRKQTLEVLLSIQESISHRAPLGDTLRAVTDGASTVLGGRPVSLTLDDPRHPERSLGAGADLTGRGPVVTAPVHIDGNAAGALRTLAGGIGSDDHDLLRTFAEHASLALTDAQTVQALNEAFRDPLTGLANRPLFLDRLTHALRSTRGPRRRLSVLFVDLDRFKRVNDSLGHAAGDEVLRLAAARIRARVRAEDVLARFGGDEFALFVEDGEQEHDAERVAERIIDTMRDPFRVGGQLVWIGVTVGLAHALVGAGGPDRPAESTGLSGSAPPDADELLGNADLAMYRAKQRGGGSALSYEPGMRAELLRRLGLERDLREALQRGELELAYQPVVAMETARITGFEALLRWHHPDRGPVSPLEFVPVAEASGLIVEIGAWVLRRSCEQLARWRRVAPDLTVNVNASVNQLRDRRFPAELGEVLASTGLPGSALVLEITESVLIEENDTVADQIRAIRALGVAVALDDFGTGYSSLGYLQRLPVDVLKIDRSFVSGQARGSVGRTLVRTIVELGRAFGLRTVAEGVETAHQADELVQLGCLSGQGFHFAPPLDARSAESVLTVDVERRRPDRQQTAHGEAPVR